MNRLLNALMALGLTLAVVGYGTYWSLLALGVGLAIAAAAYTAKDCIGKVRAQRVIAMARHPAACQPARDGADRRAVWPSGAGGFE